MDKVQLDVKPMAHLHTTILRAIELSKTKNCLVFFKFNFVTVNIDKRSDPELACRDYMNASIMDWESIGPKYNKRYSPSINKLLKENKILKEIKYCERNIEVLNEQISGLNKKLQKLHHD